MWLVLLVLILLLWGGGIGYGVGPLIHLLLLAALIVLALDIIERRAPRL
jgi:hypothetical protein